MATQIKRACFYCEDLKKCPLADLIQKHANIHNNLCQKGIMRTNLKMGLPPRWHPYKREITGCHLGRGSSVTLGRGCELSHFLRAYKNANKYVRTRTR